MAKPIHSTPSAGNTPGMASATRRACSAGKPRPAPPTQQSPRRGRCLGQPRLHQPPARRPRSAILCYQHALTLFLTLGDRYHQADTLTHLGDTHQSTGDLPRARDAWQEAASLLSDLNHPDEALVRRKLRSSTRPRKLTSRRGPTGALPPALRETCSMNVRASCALHAGAIGTARRLHASRDSLAATRHQAGRLSYQQIGGEQMTNVESVRNQVAVTGLTGPSRRMILRNGLLVGTGVVAAGAM